MEKDSVYPTTKSRDGLTFANTLEPQPTSWSLREPPRIRQPWRHSVAREEWTSPTIREFKPERQRRRLFAFGIWQWFITFCLCALLAATLGSFSNIIAMSVTQVKAFNALIVLLSLLLGNNLLASLREYVLVLRWKLLASKYWPLHEFDMVMRCESLRVVGRLFWAARTPGNLWFWLNKTQWLCAAWIGVHILLQVLVALLGLTYNLGTSPVPAQKFGVISVADLSIIRDVWGDANPHFDAELGTANLFGIQGQDYLFLNDTLPPGQGSIPSYGSPGTPTVYANPDWTVMTYVFQDQNIRNTDLTLISHRNITATASCQEMAVLRGGNGSDTFVTYGDDNNEPSTLNIPRVGLGAVTYVGVLNSTCGPRCTEVMALQSANGDTILEPSFFKCISTVSTVSAIDEYLYDEYTADTFQMPDQQARILAGAIGWSGFNYTTGDLYQYVRYNTESWWSPNSPADVGMISHRIMEFSIEAIAAMDYNGPRKNVTGYYPVPAQVANVQWRWAAAILVVIPFLQLVALICVVVSANSAIIRDDSCLSMARLLRPIVERLGDTGCLLTGHEIAEQLPDMKVKYGWREPGAGLGFSNEIDADILRHVDILDEIEGFGIQGPMPPGKYNGLEHVRPREEACQIRSRRGPGRKRSMSL